jgi:hypothetical protein
MDSLAVKIREKISELQDEFEKGVEERREKFRYRLEHGKVVFEQGVIARHRLLRMRLSHFLRQSKIGAVITAPVIYSLIIPISLLDLFITIYQNICFRIYGVPLVKRSEYVVRDRKYLQYLNIIEKINCMYCEYSNGVISYAREVASRTEQYWCPIKHAHKVKAAHDRYYDFIEYGDSDDLQAKMDQQRDKCRACEAPCEAKK